MKTVTSFYAVLITAGLICTGACGSSKSTGEKPNRADSPSTLSESDKQVILTIDRQVFTNFDFKEYIRAQYGETEQFSENPATLSRIFDQFVEHHLVLHHAEKDQVNVDQAEIDDYTKQVPVAADQPELLDSIRIQKYLYLVLYREITVSDAEIQKYYIENQEQFRKKEEVELHQILVKDRDQATRIGGTLKNFPDRFTEIAQSESVSIEAKEGGYMGLFERGALPIELEDVVFSLKINEISPVVESTFGYHIFKITRKRKQRQLPFSTVREKIYETLLSNKLRSAYRRHISQLRESSSLSIHPDALFFDYQTIQGELDEPPS